MIRQKLKSLKANMPLILVFDRKFNGISDDEFGQSGRRTWSPTKYPHQKFVLRFYKI